MRPLVLLLLVVLTVSACTKPEPPPPPRTPAQQRAAEDVLGNSRLPGAGVVKGALAVSDSAARKKALEDSIVNNP